MSVTAHVLQAQFVQHGQESLTQQILAVRFSPPVALKFLIPSLESADREIYLHSIELQRLHLGVHRNPTSYDFVLSSIP